MAKKINIPDDFSESDFIASFKSPPTPPTREPPATNSPPLNIEARSDPKPPPIEPPQQGENIVAESPKSSKERRAMAEEFLKDFGKDNDPSFSPREGRSVNIRLDHHHKIRTIVQTFYNDRITIFTYIDNLLTDHFKRFERPLKELDRKNPRF